MEQTTKRQTIHNRVVAVMKGEKPDRIPFIDRLELWHRALVRTAALPQEFQGMPLTEIHRTVGMGRQKFLSPYSIRLRGVEMISRFDGEVIYHETDPVMDRFPDADHVVPQERPGITVTEFITPVGRLTIEHTMLEHMLDSGTRSYMSKHPIVDEADLRTAEYVLERMEYVPQMERMWAAEAEVGDVGYVVPTIERIPFQQVLYDYFNTTTLFYALNDAPQGVRRLMRVLDGRIGEILGHLADLDVPYVQFGDNLDGMMTNPRLFAGHCLPAYQRYTEVLHGQGKKVGSHTDGNLKPLLNLLAESGLDVCESISPAPLTPCTFDEFWGAWQNGPIIWGGIPSPILEERTPEGVFEETVRHLLHTVGDRPIILGVGDMVLPNNAIERVRAVARMVEEHVLL